VPPPNNYDIKRNVEIKPIKEKAPCSFGNSFASYRKTCDISKDVKVYEKDSLMSNPKQYFPTLDSVKK